MLSPFPFPTVNQVSTGRLYYGSRLTAAPRSAYPSLLRLIQLDVQSIFASQQLLQAISE